MPLKRPLRTRLDEFVPRDTIPWEAHADALVASRTDAGFPGLRPFAYADSVVEWLSEATPRVETEAPLALDLGCGPGMFGNRLASAGFRVTGVDIAEPLVRFASTEGRMRGLGATYLRGSILALDDALGPAIATFDLILLVNSIVNHLSELELRVLFGGVASRLRTGGRFLCEAVIRPEGDRERALPDSVVERQVTLERSAWCATAHTWLQRDLAFPSAGERVTHHIITPDGAEPEECWSRFILHEPAHLSRLMEDSGLAVAHWYGPELGGPLPEKNDVDQRGFAWAEKS